MSICGLVVHAHPAKVAPVRAAIEGLGGTEIHAETDDGRFVVTVDRKDSRDAAVTLQKLNEIEGVLNASLVYNYFEHEFDFDRDTAEQEERDEVLKA